MSTCCIKISIPWEREEISIFHDFFFHDEKNVQISLEMKNPNLA